MFVCVRERRRVCVSVYVHACVCAGACACVCVCMCMCVCVCVCVFACICTYITNRDQGVSKRLDFSRIFAEHDFTHTPAALFQQQLAHLPHHIQPRPHHPGFHFPLLFLCPLPLLPLPSFVCHVRSLDRIHEHSGARRPAARHVR